MQAWQCRDSRGDYVGWTLRHWLNGVSVRLAGTVASSLRREHELEINAINQFKARTAELR